MHRCSSVRVYFKDDILVEIKYDDIRNLLNKRRPVIAVILVERGRGSMSWEKRMVASAAK